MGLTKWLLKKKYKISPREERIKLRKTPMAFTGRNAYTQARDYARLTNSNIYGYLGYREKGGEPAAYLVGESKEKVAHHYRGGPTKYIISLSKSKKLPKKWPTKPGGLIWYTRPGGGERYYDWKRPMGSKIIKTNNTKKALQMFSKNYPNLKIVGTNKLNKRGVEVLYQKK